MKSVATRDSSRVGLKPATARTRFSRVKPVACQNEILFESHRTLRAPTMGLFSFSQYGLLNKSQRPRLQRARSHRCHRQPPDSACAHGNPPRPLDATDSRRAAPARKAPSLALRIVLKPPRRHRSKFSARTATFCFYEAILRDKTNFQRLDRRNEAASQRTDCLSQKSRKGRSPQRSPKKRCGSPQP